MLALIARSPPGGEHLVSIQWPPSMLWHEWSPGVPRVDLGPDVVACGRPPPVRAVWSGTSAGCTPTLTGCAGSRLQVIGLLGVVAYSVSIRPAWVKPRLRAASSWWADKSLKADLDHLAGSFGHGYIVVRRPCVGRSICATGHGGHYGLGHPAHRGDGRPRRRLSRHGRQPGSDFRRR